MKIAPAIQLVMKAAVNATARKVMNLSPWACGAEIQKKYKIRIKKATASTNSL